MHEHIARVLYYLEVHLLFASLVWVAAWILTSIPRGSATVKHWIWVAVALNFLLPLGALVDKVGAAHLAWARPLGILGDVGAGIAGNATVVLTLSAVWLLGVTLMVTRLYLRLRAEKRDALARTRSLKADLSFRFLAHGIPVKFGDSRGTPGVDGVLRPCISLPHGIDSLLSKNELNAVLVHEVTHARRRDNLIRLLYEVSLCALWFHPLVWVTGGRLALYRELSCDESVIAKARGGDLISALAKLAHREDPSLLRASASSFISDRLAQLTAGQPQRAQATTDFLLGGVFAALVLAGIFETIAHTACCFIART
jgi:beta-lactamase regulating signal transducer with metallopeptidase domain